MGRRERQLNKTNSEKELMRLYRKQRNLFEQIHALGYIKLEKPIRSGYVKRYVLRKDIAKSKDAKFLNTLLDMVNETIGSHNKKFEKKDYQTKKYVPMAHELNYISTKEYKLLTDKQKMYFSEAYKYNWKNEYVFAGYHLTLPMWYFDTKISPHYIYRIRMTDAELEREYAQIRNYFNKNNLWVKIDHMLGIRQNYKSDDWWHKGRVVKDLNARIEVDKEIKEIMDYKSDLIT